MSETLSVVAAFASAITAIFVYKFNYGGLILESR